MLTWSKRPKISETEYDKIAISEELKDRLVRLRELVRKRQPINGEDREARYQDPIGNREEGAAKETYGMNWLATFWPVAVTPAEVAPPEEMNERLVKESSWVAVVQERRDEALRPVREVKSGLIKYFVGGLIVCCLLIATLWYFVLRALTQRPLLRRSGTRGGSNSSSTISATV